MFILICFTLQGILFAEPKEMERLPKVSTEIVNRPFYDSPIPNEYHIVNAAYRFLGWSRDGRYFAYEQRDPEFGGMGCQETIELQVVDAKAGKLVPDSHFVYTNPMIQSGDLYDEENCVFYGYAEVYPAYTPIRNQLLKRHSVELGYLVHPIQFANLGYYLIGVYDDSLYLYQSTHYDDANKNIERFSIDVEMLDGRHNDITPSLWLEHQCKPGDASVCEVEFGKKRDAMMAKYNIPISAEAFTNGKVISLAQMESFGGWGEVEKTEEKLFDPPKEFQAPYTQTKSFLLSDGTKVTLQMISESREEMDGDYIAYALYMISPERKVIQKSVGYGERHAVESIFVSPTEEYAAVIMSTYDWGHEEIPEMGFMAHGVSLKSSQ